MSVCCVIESIDLKLISVYFINDYFLIANLHIFVYGRAECASISLKCTKLKLLILINFDVHNEIFQCGVTNCLKSTKFNQILIRLYTPFSINPLKKYKIPSK